VSVEASDIALLRGEVLRSATARGLRRLGHDPLGLVGVVLVVAMVAIGLFADAIAPYDPLEISVRDRLQDPSWAHPLGTDQLGRDLLSRVIKGSQIALIVGVVAIGLAMMIGLALGLMAGYGPRWLDNNLILMFDTISSFPRIMLALAVLTLLGPDLTTVLLVIVVTEIPQFARLVRTATLSVKTSEFILAERSMGAGPVRILWRHILPNIIGPMFILASMDIPSAVTIEAGLSFLGLGVRPPAPSWGRILNEGYTFIRETSWIVIAGGIPLILTTLGFTFFGEALRDLLDPRLRKSV
jgi:peptide/nickel transport system permease protein